MRDREVDGTCLKSSYTLDEGVTIAASSVRSSRFEQL